MKNQETELTPRAKRIYLAIIFGICAGIIYLMITFPNDKPIQRGHGLEILNEKL